MPTFYQRNLKSTLSDKLREFLDAPKEEQLALMEELALMRAEAGRMVELYDLAQHKVETLPEDATHEDKMRAKIVLDECGIMMRMILKEVGDLCAQATKVESLQRGLITPMGLSLFVNQMVKRIHATCDHDTAVALESDIRAMRFEVDTDRQQGTLLRPDDAALDMDETIPE